MKIARPGSTPSTPRGSNRVNSIGTAPPDCAMIHIAICEMKDGKAVDLMEHVSDEQYRDTK